MEQIKQLTYKDIKTAVLSEDTDGTIAGQLTSEAVCSIAQDILRQRLTTFTFSPNSKAAIADLIDSQGAGWLDRALTYLRENQSMATMILCAGFVGIDIYGAVRRERIIQAQKESEEGDAGLTAHVPPPGPAPQANGSAAPSTANTVPVNSPSGFTM